MATATPTAPARHRGGPLVARREFRQFAGFSRRNDRPTLLLEPPVGSNDPVPDVERPPADLLDALLQSVGKALMIDCNGNQCQPVGSGSMWPIEINGAVYFVTNDHVGGSVETVVWLSADESVKCETKLLGTDPALDVAVMKPTGDVPSTLRALKFSPVKLVTGDPVMAVGCPFGLPPMMTFGRVCMITDLVGDPDGDQIPGLIAHQAVINPGNSGGPLVDALGRVHGLNTFGIMGSGFGFSVPIEIAARLLQELPESSHASWLARDMFVGDTPYGPAVLTAPQPGRFFGRAKGKIKEVTQFREEAATPDPENRKRIDAVRQTTPLYAPQFSHARTFSYVVGINGERITSVTEAEQVLASIKRNGRRSATFNFRRGSSLKTTDPGFSVKLSLND